MLCPHSMKRRFSSLISALSRLLPQTPFQPEMTNLPRTSARYCPKYCHLLCRDFLFKEAMTTFVSSSVHGFWRIVGEGVHNLVHEPLFGTFSTGCPRRKGFANFVPDSSPRWFANGLAPLSRIFGSLGRLLIAWTGGCGDTPRYRARCRAEYGFGEHGFKHRTQ